MKKIMFLFTLMMSLTCFANSKVDYIHNELNIIVDTVSKTEVEQDEVNKVLIKHYYAHDTLSLAFNDKTKDANGKTLADKMEIIAEKLTIKFGEKTDDFISDFIYHEVGCLTGGSC
jgi:hypothetical protein